MPLVAPSASSWAWPVTYISAMFRCTSSFPTGDVTPGALAALRSAGFNASIDYTRGSLAEPVHWKSILAMRAAISEHRPTVVNLHYGLAWISLKGVLGVRLFGRQVRCVADVHHAVHLRDQRLRRSTLLGASFAHTVVAHTDRMAKILTSYGISRDKIRVIPPGVTSPPEMMGGRRHGGLSIYQRTPLSWAAPQTRATQGHRRPHPRDSTIARRTPRHPPVGHR